LFKSAVKPSFKETEIAPVAKSYFDLDGMNQVSRVLFVMIDGDWRTLEEISSLTGDTTPSISARLRDLRKPKFGSYFVERRKVHENLYEYRVMG
jgi:hypothetical protein